MSYPSDLTDRQWALLEPAYNAPGKRDPSSLWSRFRRWSCNGTWARALTVLHEAAREADGRADGWWRGLPVGALVVPASTSHVRAGCGSVSFHRVCDGHSWRTERL